MIGEGKGDEYVSIEKARSMKYNSKEELVESIEKEYQNLRELLDSLPESRYKEPGVWGDDWTINDLIAHLSEWHRLFLGWYREGLTGEVSHMPAPGYKWNETPRLNRDIWRKHEGRPTKEVWGEFESSHVEVLQLVREASSEELLSPGYFPWSGKNSLATYLGPNTASHYRFAVKVVRRWLRTGPIGGGAGGATSE